MEFAGLVANFISYLNPNKPYTESKNSRHSVIYF